MKKTEAARIIGNYVRVTARQHNREITKDLVEELIGECKWKTGLYPAAAAAAPSYRTVLREAQRHGAL